MEEFKEETGKDETLQLLSWKVIQGWPLSVKKIDPEVKSYSIWPLRDDISIDDGLTFLGSRVIIPEERQHLAANPQRGSWYRKCKL